MHWAQGAERARVVPPPRLLPGKFGREISFLATLSGNYSQPPPRQASCDSDRQTPLMAECALTQKNGIGVEGTLIPMCPCDPEA